MQSEETAKLLRDKIAAFPTAGMPHFWLALHSMRKLRVRAALPAAAAARPLPNA